MSQVFLSYSRADRDRAQTIAQALEAEGFSVWWDKDLRAGQTYDEVTEGKLREAKAVVVLWSNVSVKSKWVRAEATLGERSSAVIPAMIDADAERPILFELVQTADLSTWSGDVEDEHWKGFVADIRLAVDQRSDPETAPSTEAADAPDATIEMTFWNSVANGTDPADFEAYLKRYPDGHFADLARNRIEALKADASPTPSAPAAERPAAVAPPPPARPAAKPAPARTASAKPQEKRGMNPMMLLIGALALAGVGVAGVAVTGMGAGPSIDRLEPADGASGGPARSTFSDCEACPQMTPLPGGVFAFGSPDNEPNRVGNEGPQTELTIAPFAMATTEVTFDQWQACVDGGGCATQPSPPDYGYGRGAQPVLAISWDDAQSYVRWLSAQSGKAYRLPSEAEWEYAARAGAATAYPWGAAFDRSQAPVDTPKIADAVPQNAFGLHGMIGNVAEWTGDCYVNNYNDRPSDGAAVSSGDCGRRVVRGGHWRSGPEDLRAAARSRITTSIRDRTIGFRVAASDAGE